MLSRIEVFSSTHQKILHYKVPGKKEKLLQPFNKASKLNNVQHASVCVCVCVCAYQKLENDLHVIILNILKKIFFSSISSNFFHSYSKLSNRFSFWLKKMLCIRTSLLFCLSLFLSMFLKIMFLFFLGENLFMKCIYVVVC